MYVQYFPDIIKGDIFYFDKRDGTLIRGKEY